MILSRQARPVLAEPCAFGVGPIRTGPWPSHPGAAVFFLAAVDTAGPSD